MGIIVKCFKSFYIQSDTNIMYRSANDALISQLNEFRHSSVSYFNLHIWFINIYTSLIFHAAISGFLHERHLQDFLKIFFYCVMCETFSPLENFFHILKYSSSMSFVYVLTLNNGLSTLPFHTLFLMALLYSASVPNLTAMFS